MCSWLSLLAAKRGFYTAVGQHMLDATARASWVELFQSLLRSQSRLAASPYIQRMSGDRPLAKMGLCLEKNTCGGGAEGGAGNVAMHCAAVSCPGV